MLSLGFPELVILAIVCLPPAIGLWAVVDCARTPEATFAVAGKEKTTWLLLNILGLLYCVVFPIVYLATVRPVLRRGPGPGRPGEVGDWPPPVR